MAIEEAYRAPLRTIRHQAVGDDACSLVFWISFLIQGI